VAWPLGFCSVIALGIFFERLYSLGRIGRLEREAVVTLQNGRRAGATPASPDAPVVAILAAVRGLRGAREETVLQAVDIALAQQRLRLRRYLSALATIGSTAPFIGLFGTVLGVMAAFRSMAKAGLSGETMASGIAEALSATALGLVVAIPAVFAYNYFVGRVQAFVLEIHSHVIALLPAADDGSA
jgi:biopolymer transport protein ExbB/TolQ